MTTTYYPPRDRFGTPWGGPAEIETERARLEAEGRVILERSNSTLTAEDQAAYDEVMGRLEELRGLLRDRHDRLDLLRDTVRNGDPRAFEHGDGARGHEDGQHRTRTGDARRPSTGNDLRDRARRVIDGAVQARELPEYAAERAEALVTRGREAEQDLAARWALAAGDTAYRSAFAKVLADPTKGHMMWDDREREAYQSAQHVRTAMSLTDANGGYMVPLTLDPAIMLTNDGSNNPLRQLARVVQTATDQWQGVTSAGATAEWKAEGAQAADGSPVVDDAPIPVFMGDVDVIYSYEVGMDALNFLSELQRVIMDAADNLMATAYTTGNGTTQPGGIVTGLVGGSSEINSGGTEALIAADPFTLQNALPARFSANASWQMHIATMNTFRQMETTNGAHKFPEIANGQLLNKPLHENSNMDGAINAAATANNYMVIYGDVRAGFVIADRIGATLEILPGYGANNRPTGQRHAFLTFRTGSAVVVPQALRLLDVPTTA